MELIPPGTSSEGSDVTPRRSPRTRAEEEEEGEVTPVSGSTATGDNVVGSSPNPASEVSGFGSVATDPDDDSRPVTKKELSRLRRVIEKTPQTMFADLTSLITKEVAD